MPDQSFPPAARFHHGIDFSRAFDRGQKAGGRSCLVLVRPRGRQQDGSSRPARLGVMVSVKAIRSAVRRHEVKRWARELFRIRLQERLAGWDLAVVLRSDPPDHAAFAAEVLQLLDRAMASPAEHRRRGGGGRRAGGGQRPPTGDQRPATSAQRPAAGGRPPAGGGSA